MGHRPTLGVSLGDPGGIGPEIIVKALAERELRRLARWRIYGVRSAMEHAASKASIEPFWWRVGADSDLIDTTLAHDVVLVDHEREDEHSHAYLHENTKLGGELSFRFVETAIADAMRTEDDPLHSDGLVTGPISKAAWALAGRSKYPGHTELLATRCLLYTSQTLGPAELTPPDVLRG